MSAICSVVLRKSGASIWMAKAKQSFRFQQISAVQEMIASEDGSLLFRDVSYTEPAAWFQCSKGETEPAKTALRSTSPVSFADIEVTREFATSKDGTKIPLNILCRKGTKRDGQNSDAALRLRRLRNQHVAEF